ncbi:hypothetical protein GCK72_005941 [Caenorhabditis remanei]|uniref:Structural maintenance of chromosomes protein 5 n=1 Tax=Caenorhabditis remanei TaxID=31234 RepID=A0A6A5HGP0_CAERE|nr:hypothetical protein GCK72_005941 [Caenorhabditis remanei]KAF1765987.1 hypothetical protein GCK72_005941 [Caenorhabditis remanei]
MSPDASDEVLPPNHQEFPDGSLLRVVFHNFLTYEHTCFVPTASLNMILGHNGSGKSSIICGICLACGGSPKSLGRSEKIIEYIRHGCQEGYVEVTIADEKKGPQTVRLTIRIGKAPEYKLNGAQATQSDVNELRKYYNIQIDNPCAFLAQDKVKSFSEQSSIELLKNTEKAASDDLDKKHRDLVEQRKDTMTIEEMCSTTEKTVKHLEDSRTKILPLVENYRKKLALQTKLRILQKKMACVKYEQADKEYQAELKRADEALVEYRRVENDIRKSEEVMKKLNDRLQKERAQMAELTRAANGNLVEIQDKFNKNLIGNMMEKAKMKLENAERIADEHNQEVEKTRKNIETVTEKLEEANEALVGYDDALVEYRRAEAKLSQLERENRREEDAIHAKSYELRRLEDKSREKDNETSNFMKQRYRVLQEANEDLAKAWTWCRKNRQQLKGEVYTPLIDIVLNTPESAKNLENTIGMRDRHILVCQFKEDELLVNGKHQPWSINTAVVSQNNIHRDEIHATLSSELHQAGFKDLVSNCFDAPDTLKQYLCNVSGLNRIPYGTIDESKLESITERLERLRFSVFLANGMRFQATRSRYNQQKNISTQTSLRDARTWKDPVYRQPLTLKKADNTAAQEYQKLKQEFDNQTEDLREKRRNVQKERDVLKKTQLEWKSKQELQAKYRATLNTEKRRLEIIQKESFDLSKAQEEYANVEQTVMEKARAMLEKNLHNQKEYIEKYRELGRCAVFESICKLKVTKLYAKSNESREELNNLEDARRLAEDEMNAAMNKRKVAQESLKTHCELDHLNEAKMEPADKKLYSKMIELFEESNVPTQVDDLEQAITSEKTRLKVAQDSGEDGSIEHEHKLSEINSELANATSKYEKLIQNRQGVHDKLGTEIKEWKEEVEKMIERINENYIKFFDVLGCRGEVSLETPENPLDIEKYGIMIMVCFRKGENMKRLDNKVQSGGERSVATMLYLLALQQLCPVPFRCIDEINQGMDPTNERKVFDIMVGLWNGTSGSLTKTQYFLLSPKLLHGLDMRDNVNVVMVNSTLNTSHGQLYNSISKIRKTFTHLRIAE